MGSVFWNIFVAIFVVADVAGCDIGQLQCFFCVLVDLLGQLELDFNGFEEIFCEFWSFLFRVSLASRAGSLANLVI